MDDEMPLKKRKIQLETNDDDFFIVPKTENKSRKKCAIITDGLAIKYNKLVFNFDKIIEHEHFRKYCVFFDIFSKRHMINHIYRIDYLEILNRYDFTPYAYEECKCNRKIYTSCTGFLTLFKNGFMERKKYINRKIVKSDHMKTLYEKHSILYKNNNFYDNKINSFFMQKIKEFETLQSLVTLPKNRLKTLYKNMYTDLNYIVNCAVCKNMQTTVCTSWKILRFSNRLDANSLCDYVLKLNDIFLIPNYLEHNIEMTSSFSSSEFKHDDTNDIDTKIVVYKTSPCNIVFLYNDTFHVVNSQNVIILFDIETFKKVNFFCNFNFYFIKESKTYYNNNFINIDN